MNHSSGSRIRIFVSWAHGRFDETPSEWVHTAYALAYSLDGFSNLDVEIDLWHLHETAIDWSRYGEAEIERADYVLILLDERYAERWSGKGDPAVGAGASREADILKNLYSRNRDHFLRKVIVVQLPGPPVDLPADLNRVTRVSIERVDLAGLSHLIRLLTAQPAFGRPAKVGPTPTLPPIIEPDAATEKVELSLVSVPPAERQEVVEEFRKARERMAKLPAEEIGDGPHLPWVRQRLSAQAALASATERRNVAIQRIAAESGHTFRRVTVEGDRAVITYEDIAPPDFDNVARQIREMGVEVRLSIRGSGADWGEGQH